MWYYCCIGIMEQNKLYNLGIIYSTRNDEKTKYLLNTSYIAFGDNKDESNNYILLDTISLINLKKQKTDEPDELKVHILQTNNTKFSSKIQSLFDKYSLDNLVEIINNIMNYTNKNSNKLNETINLLRTKIYSVDVKKVIPIESMREVIINKTIFENYYYSHCDYNIENHNKLGPYFIDGSFLNKANYSLFNLYNIKNINKYALILLFNYSFSENYNKYTNILYLTNELNILHNLGIIHGNPIIDNFIIRPDKTVRIANFEFSFYKYEIAISLKFLNKIMPKLYKKNESTIINLSISNPLLLSKIIENIDYYILFKSLTLHKKQTTKLIKQIKINISKLLINNLQQKDYEIYNIANFINS